LCEIVNLNKIIKEFVYRKFYRIGNELSSVLKQKSIY
jgi:hypothetical protein